MPFPRNDFAAAALTAAPPPGAPPSWPFLPTQLRQRNDFARPVLLKPYSIRRRGTRHAAAYSPISYLIRCPNILCVRIFELPIGPIANDAPWQQEWQCAEDHWKNECTYAQMRRERKNMTQKARREAARVLHIQDRSVHPHLSHNKHLLFTHGFLCGCCPARYRMICCRMTSHPSSTSREGILIV